MLDLGDRVLLKDGNSIVEDKYAVKLLLSDGIIPEHIKVIKSKESDMFLEKYGIEIGSDGEESDLIPFIEYNEVDFLNIIAELTTPRDDTDLNTHTKRLQMELNYFNNNDLNYVIVKMHNLIKQFKEDGVVWGVGRGSSCACYIFYLLEIHDVNPVKFQISFSEFSKEVE